VQVDQNIDPVVFVNIELQFAGEFVAILVDLGL
jgi:hypothetical protein